MISSSTSGATYQGLSSKRNVIFFLIFNTLYLILSGCGEGNKKKDLTHEQEQEIKKHLVEVNKINMEKESDEIDAYAQRKGWKMITSGTGLRYGILKEGKGENAKVGQY